MIPRQQSLFKDEQHRPYTAPYPSTRYQGSKRALLEWIWEHLNCLHFESVLDAFGGTGAVSHLFKTAGKTVTYNDLLAFNHQIGLALIANSQTKLSETDIELVLARHRGDYPDFIQRTFSGIYFTDDENAWLDYVVYNINHMLEDPYKQALARFALFQACIIKRPYNLFHRANLYMRLAEVKRSFGNKVSWDTPFESHFRTFAAEANRAVFDNQRQNHALCCDALETPQGYDLVYIDPPYLNHNGTGVDYHGFYHFLEGLTRYEQWPNAIDYHSKHRRLKPQPSPWNNARRILSTFEQLINHHRHSILVISYRDNGIPSQTQLTALLRACGKNVESARKPQHYALAQQSSHEILLIAT
jgi:adenine-specific DNA methylase